MYFKTLVIFTITIAAALGLQDDLVEWVDFTGDIPVDAIPVNKAFSGEYVYIGLAHIVDEIGEGYIPGNIRTGYNYMNVSLNGVMHNVTENIKILVGKNNYLSKMTWAYTNYVNFMELFDHDEYRPVRVGWQASEYLGHPYNSSLYVGKASDYVGKIFTSSTHHNHNYNLLRDVYSPDDMWFHVYEVLVYFY